MLNAGDGCASTIPGTGAWSQTESARSRDAPAPRPGARVGPYVIERPIGSGAMGCVYEARTGAGCTVALKLLHVAVADGDAALERVLHEAQAMEAMSHPNVVGLLDAGVDGAAAYLAMDYVSGPTLRAWVHGRPREQIIAAFTQAAEGLIAVHAAGVVHRDFKPANALVDRDGRVRITDFGVALRATPQRCYRPGWVGRVVGTPQYMAPEQLQGDDVDHRADQFSFAVALYEALVGARPYPGRHPIEIAAALCRPPRWPPSSVPRTLARVLRRGFARDPKRRFATMAELVAALRQAG